jgi:alpha-tubulin suppressor-like RCC1 family protein
LAVSTGQLHSCGIRTDRTLTCWGDDWMGRSTPPKGTYVALAVSAMHGCAVHTDGGVRCWGYNGYGQTDVP